MKLLIKVNKSRVTYAVIWAVVIFSALGFYIDLGMSEAYAACDGCTNGCSTSCTTKRCNGDCHCCQTSWNCGCYYCGNCSCNDPSPVNPCDPSCDCTPPSSCPSGQSQTNPAPGFNYCERGRPSCHDGSGDGCGGTCDHTEHSNFRCYDPETNTAPVAPSTMYVCIGGTAGNDDGACTVVSGSGITAANPKRITLPPHAKRVYIKTSAVSAPAGSNSRGVRYAVRVDNQTANEWSGNCESPYEYDRCTGVWQAASFMDNVNVGQVNNIGLQHGAQYHVWGHSATLDRCDDGVACMVGGSSCSSDSASCSCDHVDGYFKINTPPQVVSVNPSSGWSGTETDELGELGTLVCDDHNPQTFTVTYSDVDGASDISNVALWIDNEALSVSLLHDSMRGMLRKGSRIRIYAEGTPFDGEYATMQLLIDNEVVRTFTNVGLYNFYDYTHGSFVTASQIRVKFANEKYDPASGQDRNLRVDKIVLDGVTYQTEDPSTSTNDCCPLTHGRAEWLCCPDGYFQYSGSFKPEAGWRMFGLGYDASHAGVCGALTGPDCYKNYDWDVPSAGVSAPESSYSICSPIDSSLNTDSSSCEPSNGAPVSWTVTDTRMNGNNLEVDWKVWFYDDIASLLETELDVYGYVYDGLGAASGWGNPLGSWYLDFVPPEGTADIAHTNSECDQLLGNQACMAVHAHDNGVRDFGLGGILDWQYGINGSPVSPQPTNPVGIGGDLEWHGSVIIDGIPGGAILTGGLVDIYDSVGNVNSVIASVQEPGLPWIKTLDGDVYAALGFDNNIQIDFPPLTENWAMGSHWVGGRCASGKWEFGGHEIASHKEWDISSYCDGNQGGGWYERLSALAMGSKCREDFNSGGNCNYESGISSSSSVLDLDRGIYEYSGSTTVSGGTCTHAKVIFVNGTLTIGSTFINHDDDSACLFVAKDGVVITVGQDMGGNLDNPDMIEAAFITDGLFTVNDDDLVVDRLYIKGFVFSDSTLFKRDLVWNDNMTYPAEYIEYDTRYVYLLRDMLGNRKFEQCECGICTDYAPCEDWQ
ncbi:MAG: carbohydrate-binding domain-containing protein [Patescibacteria group bacterium]|nr:carbohydrate-binding domain-containing protein [Patescibacteria group bacterium]